MASDNPIHLASAAASLLVPLCQSLAHIFGHDFAHTKRKKTVDIGCKEHDAYGKTILHLAQQPEHENVLNQAERGRDGIATE